MGAFKTTGTFDFVGAGAVTGYTATGSWTRLTNFLECQSASGMNRVFIAGSRHAAVEATFRIQDGVGIFCSASSGTDGIYAEITYVGTETMISLYAAPEYLTSPYNGVMALSAECPMPTEYMQRGATVTMRLVPSLYGWFLSVKVGAGFKRILSLPYRIYSSAHTFLAGKRSASANQSGFFSKTAGARLNKCIMYATGSKFAPFGSQNLLFYRHDFGGSGGWNPAVGTTTNLANDSYSPSSYLPAGFTESGGNLLITSGSPSLVISQGANPPATSDQPLSVIKIENYTSGELVVKLIVAGTGKNVYINSSISGVAKAVTVETNGP